MLNSSADRTAKSPPFVPSNYRVWSASTQVAALFLGLAWANSSAAQDCVDTPEGRVCRVPQAIVAGTVVDNETQKSLGLVTVNGACSGTLLNRYWVLTAQHCLQADNNTVTASWAPGRIGRAARTTNFGPADIALVYLGLADLGPVNSQRIYMIALDQGNGSTVLSGRLRSTDTVTQYGRGYSTFATGVFGTPSATPSTGIGTYRSAQFTPSEIDAAGYTLAMNASGQVGQGGDSGGPTVVTVNGVGVGIAGVQSTCTPTGYVPNTPANQQGWRWATGVSACQYVSAEPFFSQIRDAIRETPESPQGATYSIGAIVQYYIE